MPGQIPLHRRRRPDRRRQDQPRARARRRVRRHAAARRPGRQSVPAALLPGPRARYALPTQLFFLFQRVNQLRDLAQADLFRRPRRRRTSCSTRTRCSRASRWTTTSCELYQQIYAHLQPQAPTPDLVIYLQAPPGDAGRARARRGVSYEDGISDEYLRAAGRQPTRGSSTTTTRRRCSSSTPSTSISSTRRSDFELLLERIAAMRGPREFFTPRTDLVHRKHYNCAFRTQRSMTRS